MRLVAARPAAAALSCAASALRARRLASSAAPRRAASSSAVAAEAASPAASRSVHVGNLPFDAPPADVAAALLASLRGAAGGGASAAQLVTRVVVSDYSACGCAEFDCSGGEAARQPLPPPWPGAHADAPRKARDEGKRNRGFALLCCASAGAAAAATAALAQPAGASAAAGGVFGGRALRVGGDGGAAAARYVREAVAAAAGAEAARDAEREARRAARAPHRQRQKARARAARDADLAALLRAAFGAPPGAVPASSPESEPAAVEALWAGAFSGWADAQASAAAGALPWDDAPAAADPCRGGGLDPAPGGRGERKRRQVETFVAALKGLRLAPPGATLVDFGAGTGNLALALAWALPACRVVAVDAKAQSVALLAERANSAGLLNCTALEGDIAAYDGPCDVALGLHVCGRGTDAVLAAAQRRRAPFLVSPCCIGKVNLRHDDSGDDGENDDDANDGALIRHPRSRALRRRLSGAEYARLAAAADFSGDSHVDGYDTASGAGALPRAAKAAVEADRAAAAAEARFGVALLKLLHPSACVRNDLLVGWPAEAAAAAAAARALFAPPPAPPPYAQL
jgi:hypothetical protein